MSLSNFELFAQIFRETRQNLSKGLLSSENRLLTVTATIDKDGISKNIETLYNVAINRALEFGYQLEWAATLERSETARPELAVAAEGERRLRLNALDTSEMSTEQVRYFNSKFAQRIRQNCLRDLSELFELYLVGIYRIAALVVKDDKPINEAYNRRVRKFDWLSLKEKLKRFRTLGFLTRYHDALISLAVARNIYTHTDPILCPPSQEHFENEIIWYSHTVRFREAGTGRLIELGDMPKYFSGDSHSQLEITYLDPRRHKSKVLDEGGNLILTDEDFREIFFLYMGCFELYQSQMLKFAAKNGITVKPLTDYDHHPKQSIVFIGEDIEDVAQ